ncbi:MAG: hypothetical protein Kow00117_12790 [Phototrophicales bacterium]
MEVIVPKVAVMMIHGIGDQTEDYVHESTARLVESVKQRCGDGVVFANAYWADVLSNEQKEMQKRLKAGGVMHYNALRTFLIDFVGDALAYQPTPHNRTVYDKIHVIVANTMQHLAQNAGENAPLVIIGHSLGTIIASNYIYDLQIHPQRQIIPAHVEQKIGQTPLERAETLVSFYSLGCPLPLWSLRFDDFGTPIQVPSPNLQQHYPNITGEWVNFYDQDDILAYPLRTLNEQYQVVVTQDRQVNVGRFYESWNPLSHMGYWKDHDVIQPITDALYQLCSRLGL